MAVFLRAPETKELAMRRKRFMEEQIVAVLREHEAGGTAREEYHRHARAVIEGVFSDPFGQGPIHRYAPLAGHCVDEPLRTSSARA